MAPGHRTPALRPSFLLLFLLQTTTLLLLLPTAARAQSSAVPTTYNGSSKYLYRGCYNETVAIPDTAGDRAIGDGPHEVLPGTMTVPDCLGFCSANGTAWKYAGVEYSRECWCGDRISALSVREPDSDCDLACDGNAEMICGGLLKLSVYMLSAAASNQPFSGALVALVAMAAASNLI